MSSSSAGGAHLLPLLEKYRDVLVLNSRLGKVAKADALHRARTMTVAPSLAHAPSEAGFGSSAAGAASPRSTDAVPGTPYTEHALTTAAMLKLRSYEPLIRRKRLATVTAAPPSISSGAHLAAASSSSPTDPLSDLNVVDMDAVLAPIPPTEADERRPSEVVWRMPHCYVRSVEPLPSAAADAPPAGLAVPEGDDDATGPPAFVVTFFSTKLKRKAVDAPTVAAMVARVSDVSRHVPFTLRAREYECSSAAVRADWLSLYRAAVANYWHERLEATIVAAPEVYQFHVFAQDCTRGHKLVQVVLSTTALYVVARWSAEMLEHDEGVGLHAANGTVTRALVGELRRVAIDRAQARVEVAVGSSGSAAAVVSLQLYTVTDAVRFVVELQRTWDMVHQCGPAGGGGDGPPFPFDMR